MLAGVETMRRHRDILQGAHFVWLTDHKALTYLLNQRDLPGRLARWFVTISEFDFEVQYIAGAENILPDALSRMYTFDAPGTERSPSEYAEFDTDVRQWQSALAVGVHAIVGWCGGVGFGCPKGCTGACYSGAVGCFS
jgi:hypothetical protein